MRRTGPTQTVAFASRGARILGLILVLMAAGVGPAAGGDKPGVPRGVPAVDPLGHLDARTLLKARLEPPPYAPAGPVDGPDIDRAVAVRIAQTRVAGVLDRPVGAPVSILPLYAADGRVSAYDVDFALADKAAGPATLVTNWQEFLAGRTVAPGAGRLYAGPHAGDYYSVTVAASYDAPPVRSFRPGVSNYYAVAPRLREALRARTGATKLELRRIHLTGSWERSYEFATDAGDFIVEGHEPYAYYRADTWLAAGREALAAARTRALAKAGAGLVAQAREAHRRTAEAAAAGAKPAYVLQLIPDYEQLQPLVWWGGCTPTAASMVMTYYHATRPGLRLVRDYEQLPDPTEPATWVCRVPDCSPELRRAMGTDGEGSTYIGDIIGGLQSFMDSRSVPWQDGIDFVGSLVDWHFAAGAHEIDLGHPFIWGLDFYPQTGGDGHSVTVIGYDSGLQGDFFICYNTWWDGTGYEGCNSEGEWTDWSSGDGVRPTTNPGSGIALVQPLGNMEGNDGDCGTPIDYGTGESILARYDIVGDPDIDTIQIDLSFDAGRTWTNLGTGPTQPGQTNQIYLPVPPNPGSTAARLRLRATRYGTEVLADASRGDFTLPQQAANVAYAEVVTGLPGLLDAAAGWGDYDADGDLDLVLTGKTGTYPNYTGVARIYRNDAGAFTDIGAALPVVLDGAVAWGDYDRDGDLDLVITGSGLTRIYRNDGGLFVSSGIALPNLESSAAAWGDFDNDGDLDLALAGYSGYAITGNYTRIYRNDGATFTDIAAGLPGVDSGALAWGDYDGDGDPDLLVAGHPAGSAIARVYRNDGGAFADIGAGLTGVRYASAAWGDYDDDGDPDLLLAGDTGGGPVTRLYRNDGGTFVDIGATLTGVANGSVAFGDADNDGDPDILISGYKVDGPFAAVFRNASGVFGNLNAGLTGAAHGAAIWGDFDNSGQLDCLVTGDTGAGLSTKLYRGSGAATLNTRPLTPYGLVTTVTGSRVDFNWTAASDGQTPVPALTYNLRVGTTINGAEMCPPMSMVSGAYPGRRLLPAPGGAGQHTSAFLNLPATPARYYWSVQTVDGAFAGSTFGSPQSFIVGTLTDVYADIGAGLTGVGHAATAWGDYDGDGDLDLVVAGETAGGPVTRLYRNDGGVFVASGVSLPGVQDGAVAWADFDNDGDLDLLLAGWSGAASFTRLYRNTAGAFADAGAALANLRDAAAAWGDFDRDGDLDLLLTGWTGSARVATLYRNTGGVFTDAGAGLPGVRHGAAAWSDYDADGDLDLLLAGDAGSGYLTRVYRNDLGVFNDLGLGLLGVSRGAVAWSPQEPARFAITGSTANGPVTVVYRISGGAVSLLANSAGLYESCLAWGDYDNDGNDDLVVAGSNGVSAVTRVLAGGSQDIGAGLPGVQGGAVAWGDFNGDGRLDLALAGTAGGTRLASIYRCHDVPAGSPPIAPAGLVATPSSNGVTLAWNAATDGQTPAASLTYNLRLGTTPGGSEVASAMSSTAGFRRIAQAGNARWSRSLRITLPAGLRTYYWSVQAVDGAFAGSPFAAEQSFAISSFTDIVAGLPAITTGAAAWGDFDNDGDLDLAITGDTGSGDITRIYRNSGGAFTDIGAGLPGLRYSKVTWGDYDNDGDLDLLISGTSGATYVTSLYRNTGGVFADTAAGLPGAASAAAAWGDYDNDGDLDLLLAGDIGGASRLYRNDAGVFVDSGTTLPGVSGAAVAWGDYNNDGTLEFTLAGYSSTLGRLWRIYRWDSNGGYVDSGIGLIGLDLGCLAWGDYDADGDLDLAFTGRTNSGQSSGILRNDAGTFVGSGAVLAGLYASSLAWGDYDNDGDLDLALGGTNGSGSWTLVYRNNGGGSFTDIGAGMAGTSFGSVAWGDYNNDGALDLLMVGMQGTTARQARIYRTAGVPANTAPAAPAGLTANWSTGYVTLAWSAATDAQTPAAGLGYNLRIGTTPGGHEIAAAMAAGDGWRRLPQPGNAQQVRTRRITLPAGARAYYWSVQAVDGAWAGSPFAAEQSFRTVTLTEAASGLPAGSGWATAWGDYDNDGDLDVVLVGYNGSSVRQTSIYRNDGGVFTDIGAGLPGLASAAVAWADYDNDGDLDLALAGDTGSAWTTRVYRNGAGIFTDSGATLPVITNASLAWGDYDRDGDQDLLLMGGNGTSNVTLLLRNDGGVFVDAGAGLPGTVNGGAAWGDYDGDGDLDLALTGNAPRVTSVYRNDDGVFTSIGTSLVLFQYGSAVAWGDYDNDGDLDLAVVGKSGTTTYNAYLYRNDAGAFTAVSMGSSISLYAVSVAWGDYDNDGDLDLALGGGYVYRNDGGTFRRCVTGSIGSVAWGDYDRDGDLDLLVGTGKLLRSDGAPANSPPRTPAGLANSFAAWPGGDRVTLSWTAPTDDLTPTVALSYNLRVGTTPGGHDVLAPQAAGGGLRQVPAQGSVQTLAWVLNLPPGSPVLYWSVQALDATLAGGPFAPERRFSRAWTGVDEPPPGTFALEAASPNPFNPATTVAYATPQPARVRLVIFDAKGRQVRVLVDEARPAGRHTARWDGADDRGRRVASGAYFCRMEAGGFRATQRLTLVK